MGLILDTSVLIAAEKRRFDLPKLYAEYAAEAFFIAAITASELLHGVERAHPPARKNERSKYVESILSEIETIDFDLSVARQHAIVWASLEKEGQMVGPYDLLIAATALQYNYAVATLNLSDFQKIAGVRLIDPTPFQYSAEKG